MSLNADRVRAAAHELAAALAETHSLFSKDPCEPTMIAAVLHVKHTDGSVCTVVLELPMGETEPRTRVVSPPAGGMTI